MRFNPLLVFASLAIPTLANPLPTAPALQKRDVFTYTTTYTFTPTPPTATFTGTYILPTTIHASPTTTPPSTCGNLLINPLFTYDINPTTDWTGTLISGLSIYKLNSFLYGTPGVRVFLVSVSSNLWAPYPVEYKLTQSLRTSNTNCGAGAGERYSISTQVRSQWSNCYIKFSLAGVELGRVEFSNAAGNLNTWVPVSYEVEPMAQEQLEVRFRCDINSGTAVESHLMLGGVVVEKL